MVAISQAPSPESNPNSPSPVISLVGPYPTINLIGQSFLWSIVLKGLPSSISRLAVWRPQHTHPKRGKHDAFPYLSLFIAPHTDVLPSGHKSSSCQSVTHMSPLPLSLLPASCLTAQHWHHCAFPFASWTTEPHTLQHTLPCHHPFQHMCHHTLSGSANHTHQNQS